MVVQLTFIFYVVCRCVMPTYRRWDSNSRAAAHHCVFTSTYARRIMNYFYAPLPVGLPSHMERGVGFEPTYTGFEDLIINNILCCIRLKWRSTRELNPSLLADNQVWYRFTSKPYTRHIILLLYPLSYLRKNGSRSRTRTDNRKITFRLLYVPF